MKKGDSYMIKLKTPEKMRCSLNVGYQICDTQSEIFELAGDIGFDDDDFIKKYMTSDFCHREMDAMHSWFHLADAQDAMDYILKEITPKKNSLHYDPDAIKWIGWMYKYLQLRFEIPSKELYQRLPLKDMLNYYEGMHTQDEEFFVNVLNENQNFWRKIS
jgi:hypothetical protein